MPRQPRPGDALGSYDAAVLVDAVPLGEPPGTLAVIEPEVDDEQAEIETHAMDPMRVLRLARELNTLPPRTLVVGCQPGQVVDPENDEVFVELSGAVGVAVGAAVRLVRSLVEELVQELPGGGKR